MDIILDIDTQVDFMMREGALYVPDAESITENIKRFLSNTYMPIISTVDEHDVDDQEFKTFPKHCVKQSSGAWKIPETMVYTLPYLSRIMNNRDVFSSESLKTAKQFIIPKKTYNIWDVELGNPLAMMQVINQFKPETVHVIGVATDICVLAGVKGIAQHVKKVVIHSDCVKGLSAENEDKAFKEMFSLGNVELI